MKRGAEEGKYKEKNGMREREKKKKRQEGRERRARWGGRNEGLTRGKEKGTACRYTR